MTIEKHGSKFALVSKATGRTLGTHPTKKAAQAQEAAVNIAKGRAHGHRIPRKHGDGK